MIDPEVAALLQALEVLQKEPEPVVYRLYYDNNGKPLVYTCDQLPGNWIAVSADEFAKSSYKVRVVNNKLIHITPEYMIDKLVPNSEQGTPCHTYSVCVPVNEDQTHMKWTLKNAF